jgi:hypothetical protein
MSADRLLGEGVDEQLAVVPDGIVPLVGYREWALWLEADSPPRLRSLFHPTVWPHERPLGAVCLRPLIWNGRTGARHRDVPDPLCECGIYAFRRPEFESLRGARGPKARGVVKGWGRYVLGTSGWRCEFARIVALFEDLQDRATTYGLANRYGVPVLSVRESFEVPPAIAS